MATESETDVLLFSLPVGNRPGTDLMSKHVLQTDEAKDIIIEAVIGKSLPILLENIVFSFVLPVVCIRTKRH